MTKKPGDPPRPEDFPLGSLESRVAVRAMLDARKKQGGERRIRIESMIPELSREFIVDDEGNLKQISGPMTQEDWLAHPFFQPPDIKELEEISRQVSEADKGSLKPPK